MTPEQEAVVGLVRLLENLGIPHILAVNPGIDRAYVERWAAELGVLELWREISSEAGG